MTIVKSLVTKGFKSFAKRTELLFDNGFNVIVGPNGAGKSNIVDAFNFVLGKTSAKGMRAERAANLIYNGGKKKSPAKEAEVSVIFDNSKKEFPVDAAEVVISRIVKQSGQSTYKINNETRTRQQIVDLLSSAKIDPDGHNIILQGDIVHFTEMKSEERRLLIEEIAGISVYEDKKQKTLNELSKVQSKLSEAEIILTEREAYLRELKKDRDQALKYKEIQESIRDNKATYLHLQIKDKEAKQQEVDSKIDKQKKEIASIEKNLNSLKEDLDKKKSAAKNINKEIEEKGEHEQVKLHQEIENLREGIIRKESRLEVCRNELSRIEARKKQLNSDLSDIDGKISSLNKEKEELLKKLKNLKSSEAEIDKKISSFRRQHGFDGNETEDLDDAFEKKSSELSKLQEEKQEILNKKSETSFEIRSINDRISDINNLLKKDKGNSEKLKKAKADLQKTTQDLDRAVKENSFLIAELNSSRNNLVMNTEKLAALRARQLNIKERISGDNAVKEILKRKNVYGTVSDLGNVNKQYSLALEVAAGSRLRSVVVENDEVAAECISHLKNKKLGVVTFFPLNKIKYIPVSSEAKQLLNFSGVKGLARDLVKYDDKFTNIFSYVFGNTIVVDNIQTVRKIGVGRARMVTMEGDLIETSGAMIGGFRKARGSFSERELQTEIKTLEAENNKLRKALESLEKKKISSEEKIIKSKEQKAVLEVEISALGRKLGEFGDINSLEKKKDDLIEREKSFAKEINGIDSNIKDVLKDLDAIKSKKQKIKEKFGASNVLKSLESIEQEKQKLMSSIVEVSTEIKNIDTQINNIHLAEKDKISNIVKNQDKEIEEFQKELDNLTNELKNARNALREKESSEKRFQNEFKALFVRRNRLNEEINKKDANISKEEDKIKFIETRINTFNIDRAKVVAELEALNKEFEDYTDAKIRRGISLEDLKYEIKKNESILQNMGNVNLRALEIYEQVEKEYEVLTSKVDKLKLEKDDIMAMMAEIDGKKKEIFMKTFKVVNENFKRIFSSLSTKGDAHLEIEDEENLFETGIDIKVRIIGNKFLDIKSLSGGEKTLTALAFIFSIQEVEPASFYLLDEVDAALDKRNSELLSKLINKYSSTAQYIVISHNDSVITEAQQLYGVSMQDGESKVVSLKI